MKLICDKTISWQQTAAAALLFAMLVYGEVAAEEPNQAPVKSAAIDSQAASPQDIQKWVSQLSDDAFPVRQAAAARLLAAGTPARDALVAVSEGPEPEARSAARRLIALIDRTDFNRRLEAFAADTDGKRGLTLPGWDRFRKLVGSDSPARALFVDMQRAEGTLISAAFGVSSHPPEQLWEERLTRLVMNGNRSAAPPLGSCAAVVFLGAVPEIHVSDRGANLIENLIQQTPIREAMSPGAPQDVVRRLIVAWIIHCPNKNEVVLASRLQLISAINLKGGLPLALAVAGVEEQYAEVNSTTRALAVLIVGQFGAPEHAVKLEPLLEDARVCIPPQMVQPGQPVSNVQVRDVAMCVMLQLTGQKPSDYGYLHAHLPPQQVFDIRKLHAANDQVRAEAAAKWKAWRDTEEGQRVGKSRESRVKGRHPDASKKNPPP